MGIIHAAVKNSKPSHILQLKIQALQSEEDAYAADELVELGEEILSQLAAMGIAAYLKQANQKEVFNDFLISLFLSDGHSYNAGPLFRWAANMIKDAEGAEAKRLHVFFGEKKMADLYSTKSTPPSHLAKCCDAWFFLYCHQNAIERKPKIWKLF